MTAAEMMQRVQAGHFDAEELLALYKNCLSKNVPELLDAIHTQLWQRFPAKARKRFGAKGKKAQMTLEALAKDLAARYDLRDNQVGSHVKVGGLARAKDGYFLDLYISYKRKDGESVALSLLLKDPDSEETAQVTRSQKGKDAIRESVVHPAEPWPEAMARYEAQLAELLTPG